MISSEVFKPEKLNLIMYKIARAVNTTENLDELFSIIHANLEKLYNTKNFFIALYDREADEVTFPYFVDEMDKQFTIQNASQSDSLTFQVVNSNNPVFLNELQLMERRNKSEKKYWGSLPKAWIGVPLSIKDKVVGAIALQSYTDADIISAEDIPFLSIVAEQLAIAIDRKRAENEIQQLNQDLENKISERTAELTEANSKLMNEIDLHKLTMHALKENEERTRLIIDTALDAVVTIDASSKILDWNSRAKSIFGFTSEEAIGKFLTETIIPERFHAAHLDGMHRFTTTGKARILNTLVEIFAIHKNGEEFPVELAISNIKYYGKDTFTAFIRDITKRKKAEENIKISEERYRLLFENANIAILIAQDGMVKFANPKTLSLSGYSHEEITSVPFFNLVHPEDRALVLDRYVKRLSGNGEEESYVFRIVTKNGIVKNIEINAIIFNYEGKPATLSFLIDITERLKAEQEVKQALEKEKELNELKSRFVSMASHEFRTPLTSILSSAELLENYKERLTEEKRSKYLRNIKDSADHMTQLLNDVLLVEKYETGKVEIQTEKINLNSLCEGVLERFTILTSENRIIYEPVNISDEVVVDPKLLRQVIENLISNSLKYSIKKVHFRVEQKDEQVLIQIKDEGVGIPEEDMKRLFEPFHRASNVNNIPGTGLGLTIIKRAVELHGGRIKVESRLNEGTAFFINIPIN